MRYLVDANLLVGYNTRMLMACLAEHGGHQLILTPDIESETRRAIKRISLRNPLQAPQQQDRFSRWVEILTRGDCLVVFSPDQIEQDLSQRLSSDRHTALIKAWTDPDIDCDPDDLHLAEAAIACRVDAVLTNNMGMDGTRGQGHWDIIMQAILAGPPLPALVRRDAVVAQLLGVPDVDAPAVGQTLLGLIVPAMEPATDYKTPLTRYATHIRQMFPRTAQTLAEAVNRASETMLQALHAKEVPLPLTREIARENVTM